MAMKLAYKVSTCSSGVHGRAICNVRNHHFIADDGGGDEVGAGEYFLSGIGGSWGGYESLVMPFDPRDQRSVTKWPYPGPCFRVHAGLEAIEDLVADLDAG
ncbi:MAG: hypothetical protein EXR28_16025, partial [Betaproteobacteria bacterium]|nr:hypothetical protein [Betaproteobacteria bacterium]